MGYSPVVFIMVFAGWRVVFSRCGGGVAGFVGGETKLRSGKEGQQVLQHFSLWGSLSLRPYAFVQSGAGCTRAGGCNRVQHSESLQLDPKSLGKLKTMGCVLQSAAALTLPKRRPFSAVELSEGRALYIGGRLTFEGHE